MKIYFRPNEFLSVYQCVVYIYLERLTHKDVTARFGHYLIWAVGVLQSL